MASRKNMFVSKLKLMLHIHTWPNGKPNLKKNKFYQLLRILQYSCYCNLYGVPGTDGDKAKTRETHSVSLYLPGTDNQIVCRLYS